MRTCSKCGGTEFDEVFYRCVKCERPKLEEWDKEFEGGNPSDEDGRGKGEGEGEGNPSEDTPLEGAGGGQGEGEGEGEGEPPPPDQIVLYPGEIVKLGDIPYLVVDISPNAFQKALTRQQTVKDLYEENLLFTVALDDGKVRLRTERHNLQYSPTGTLDACDVLEKDGNTEIVGIPHNNNPCAGSYTLLNMESGAFDTIPKDAVGPDVEKLVDKTPKKKGRK